MLLIKFENKTEKFGKKSPFLETPSHGFLIYFHNPKLCSFLCLNTKLPRFFQQGNKKKKIYLQNSNFDYLKIQTHF